MLIKLTHLGLIKVQGIDAEKFLQSQLTCDVTALLTQQSCLGAYCNPQGRIWACFRLFRQQNDFYLFMPQEIIANTLKVLGKYAIFSKVQLSDATTDFAILGGVGKEAIEWIKTLSNHAPSLIFSYNNELRYEAIIPNDQLPAITSTMEITTHSEYWDYLDILADIPAIYATTIGLFTPHQINYPELGGISFKKGCYPGQEIVARMHYLGKIKQRMHHVTFSPENNFPQPGAELCNASSQVVGNIVRLSAYDPHLCHMLAVIQDNAIQIGNIFIKETMQQLILCN